MKLVDLVSVALSLPLQTPNYLLDRTRIMSTRDRIARLGLFVFVFFGIIGLVSYFLPKPSEKHGAIQMAYAECVAENDLPGDYRSFAGLKPLEQLSPKERGVVLGCAANSQLVSMVRWALGEKYDHILIDRKVGGLWPMAAIASWQDGHSAVEALNLLKKRESAVFLTNIDEQWVTAAYGAATVEVARYLDTTRPELLQREPLRLTMLDQYSPNYLRLTLAQYHALHGRFNVAQYFADRGSNVIIPGKSLRHLIFDKERKYLFDDNLEQFLVSQGVQVDERDEKNRTLLHCAVEAKDEKLVRRLLARKAGVNVQDVAGDTPLHYAVRKGDAALLSLLLASANPDARNFKGRTPLQEAFAASAWDVASVLLDKGARLDVRDTLGRTPVFDCVLRACPILDRLVASGADIGAVDKEGNTLLHLAAQTNTNNADLTSDLIARGAPLKLKNKAGKTPLHLFSESGDVGSVDLLLAKGCDPNQMDRVGNTPLHLARITDMASALLDAGANPDLANKRGERPVNGNLAHTQMLFHSPSQIKAKAETLPRYFRDIRVGEKWVELSSPIAGTFMLTNGESGEAGSGEIRFVVRATGLEYRVEQSCQMSVKLITGDDSLILKPLPASDWIALTSAEGREGVFLLRGNPENCKLSNVPTDTTLENLLRRGEQVSAKWRAIAILCNGAADSPCQTFVTPMLRISVKSGKDWKVLGVISARDPEL